MYPKLIHNPPPLPYSSNFVFFLLQNQIMEFTLYCPHILGMASVLECFQPTRGHTFKEHGLFLSHQLLNAISSLTKWQMWRTVCVTVCVFTVCVSPN